MEVQNIPPINLTTAIRDYFELRTHLGNLRSEFRCNPDCTRPGCKNPDMHIAVTVFDLMGAALEQNESVDAIYFKNYGLGIVPFEGQTWIQSVSLKLRKPCPYLKEDKCGIYGVRPLPCIFFPEWHVVDGTLKQLAGQSHFKDYHCLHNSFQVPEKRSEIIRKLAWMMDREVLLSNHYLFHYSPLLVDFSYLQEEFLQKGDKSLSQQVIPFERLERSFDEMFRRSPPLADIEERILALKETKLQKKLFDDLENHSLVKKLMQKRDDRPFVFEIKNGRPVAKRKSLLSAEQRFIW